MTTNEKLAALRQLMLKHHLDAFLIPTSDPHQSEYLAEYWKERAWITGFTGSAGTVIITQDHAGLWTDSRYFIQAETQLADSEFELHKMTPGRGLEYDIWMASNLSKGARIGCNGILFSINQIKYIQKAISGKEITLEVHHDFIAEIWQDRPPLPESPIFDFPVHYAGEDRCAKIEAVRARMADLKVDWYLISALDETAWLFNLRGSDIDCNPVFYSYALLSAQDCYLFVHKQKLAASLIEKLDECNIKLLPYEAIISILERIPERDTVLLDVLTTSIRLNEAIRSNIMELDSMIRDKKAIKNTTEIQYIKQTMEKDGVALVRLFKWIEDTLKHRTLTEWEIAEQCKKCRAAMPYYKGESFDAIVGYNANGAIIHYHAEKESSATIYAEGILLLDCGGQYLDGTTDITRTIALGTPTSEQKRDFTLVLKGNIALDQVYFPYGTNGIQLDAVARQALWTECMNYGHGTGHGVGFFLNVHESPPKMVATTNGRAPTTLKVGMVMSNEPGIYRKDKHGIRIENLLLCVAHTENEFGKFLKFETLSLYPIDLQLVDVNLLDAKEITWLNQYHERVLRQLSPYLNEEEKTWLAQKCKTISRV
jgi:Xaa-Pro aminopeptidase